MLFIKYWFSHPVQWFFAALTGGILLLILREIIERIFL